MSFEIPWLAVMAAALANFALGGLWYGIFGHLWLQALGKKLADLNPRDPKPYVVAAVSSVVSAATLAVLIKNMGATTLDLQLLVAALVGVGICAFTAVKHYAFSDWSLRLFAIDLGLDVVGFLMMALVMHYAGRGFGQSF
jgi:hypothetical protein